MNIIQMIGNTPLIEISEFFNRQNIKVFAKLEGYNPSGSIKDRIALRMIQQAENEGKLDKNKTILEATSGNTGISLAMISTIKQYKTVIIMSEAVSIERRKIIKAYGGDIILTAENMGTDGAIKKAKELLLNYPDKYFMPDQFSNQYNKLAHYKTTAEEIWRQTNGTIHYFVSSIGTSGTIMGIGQGLKELNKDIKIVEAHPEKGHYIQGLKNMEEAIVPELYDKKQIDHSFLINSEEAYKMTRDLIKKTGIFCGMSSGAAALAVKKLIDKINENSLNTPVTIVVIFPDRGEKYLSTKLFP